MKWSVVLMAMLMLLAAQTAGAKRLGGGKPLGRQSENVSQQGAQPSQNRALTPVAPAPQAPNPAVNPTPSPAPNIAPNPPRHPVLGLMTGLAAGIGLAWLAHSMGVDESFGQILMFIVIVGAVWWLLKSLMRSRRNTMQPVVGSPFAMVGGGNVQVGTAPDYRPENVGNDASARPFERTGNAPLEYISDTPALPGFSTPWGVPAGFDTAGFLSAAKANFIGLQGAWDRSDIPALRIMMTDVMLAEIRSQLAEREQHVGGQPNTTEVVTLDARLLGIEELKDEYLASVEFSGLIREELSMGPSPFREVWNMSKSRTGQSGWLVAGVQALQ